MILSLNRLYFVQISIKRYLSLKGFQKYADLPPAFDWQPSEATKLIKEITIPLILPTFCLCSIDH